MKYKIRFITLCMFLLLLLPIHAVSPTQNCPSEDYLQKVHQYIITGTVLENTENGIIVELHEINFTAQSPYQQLGVYTNEITQIREKGVIELTSQQVQVGSTILAYADKEIGQEKFKITQEPCALTITEEPVNVHGGLMFIIILLLIAAGIYYIKGRE